MSFNLGNKPLILLLVFTLFTACKSDKTFDLDPVEPATGIFEARGTITPLNGGISSWTFAYISGETDPWGNTVVASTYNDYVNYNPYKTIVGRLTHPSVDIFSISIQSQKPFDPANMAWQWSESEIDQLFQPGDTLRIGFGPGEAVLGVAHPEFNNPTGPLYTSPSENIEGINADGPGYVIIDDVEPYTATAYEKTRAGLRVHMHFQGRLNGILGQTDYWTEGTAVLFFEY